MISNLIDIVSARQKKPLGLGHAIWTARHVVGDEPFMVLLGDDLVLAETLCARQLLDLFDELQEPIVAVQRVPKEQTCQYGIVEGGSVGDDERTLTVECLIEKPAPGTTDSDMAIIGRYIIPPEIFLLLSRTTPGYGGEIQLTDALLALNNQRSLYACEFDGTRFDAGDKLGYLKAIVAYGLQHEKLDSALKAHIMELAGEL